MIPPPPSVLPPGRALLVTGEPHVAGSFRIFDHEGARIELGSGNVLQAWFDSGMIDPAQVLGRAVYFPQGTSVRWLAWYSPKIVENGWQPFDQPHPAAYLPLSYAAFEETPTPDGGAVLWKYDDSQRWPLLIPPRSTFLARIDATKTAEPCGYRTHGRVDNRELRDYVRGHLLAWKAPEAAVALALARLL